METAEDKGGRVSEGIFGACHQRGAPSWWAVLVEGFTQPTWEEWKVAKSSVE